MIKDWDAYRKMAKDLSDGGYVPVFGEFCDELEEVVVECILLAQKRGKTEMTLLINSNGGRDDCFNGIKAAMTMTSITFTGLVMSCARSNGFRLLQHCNKRQAIRNADLMFHWGSYRLHNGEIAAILEGQDWPIDHLKAWREATMLEVHERTGVPIDDLRQYALFERPFMASEALKMNFIDEVIEDVPAKVKKVSEGAK